MAINKRRKLRYTSRFKSSKVMKVVAVVVGLSVLLFILELINTTHLFHKEKIPAVIQSRPGTISTNGKSNASNQKTSTSNSNNSTPTNSKTPSSTGGNTDANLTLVAPYGDFVSNHHPGDGPSLDEVSICNTTPGATCYIQLKNGGAVTRLAAQTVGSDGSTRWDWNIGEDAHLTPGEWLITAIASLNGQTKSTDDGIKLVVQ